MNKDFEFSGANQEVSLKEYKEAYRNCKTFEDLNKLTEKTKEWERRQLRPITPDWYVAHNFSTSCSNSAKQPFNKETNLDGWTIGMFERNLMKWKIKNKYVD